MANHKINGFAAQLQKFYDRRGNKIVFSNGMSLNKLAWEMWERLDYSQIDPSVLSRVLKGERLFTLKQLRIFENIIGLSKGSRNVLSQKWEEDVFMRYGIDRNVAFGVSGFISLAEVNLAQIKRARVSGLSVFAADLAEITSEHVSAYLRDNDGGRETARLMKLLANILIEQATGIMEVETPEKFYRPVMKISGRVTEIGRELKDTEIIGKAESRRGDIFHVRGGRGNGMNKNDLKKSLDYLSRSVKLLNGDEKAYSLRVAALSTAQMGNKFEYETLKKELIELVPRCTHFSNCESFAKMVRSETYLGLHKVAEKTLEIAWDQFKMITLETGEIPRFRKLQLARAQIELEISSKTKETASIEKLGKEGLGIAVAFGFRRYEESVRNLLEKHLN